MTLKKIIYFLLRGFIAPLAFIREGLTGREDTICMTGSLSHDWVYWDAKYVCNDPNHRSLGYKQNNGIRQCTKCKIKQQWFRWGGSHQSLSGGDPRWNGYYGDLPLDKNEVEIEIFTTNQLHKRSQKRQLEKKQEMQANDRDKRINNVLKGKDDNRYKNF